MNAPRQSFPPARKTPMKQSKLCHCGIVTALCSANRRGTIEMSHMSFLCGFVMRAKCDRVVGLSEIFAENCLKIYNLILSAILLYVVSREFDALPRGKYYERDSTFLHQKKDILSQKISFNNMRLLAIAHLAIRVLLSAVFPFWFRKNPLEAIRGFRYRWDFIFWISANNTEFNLNLKIKTITSVAAIFTGNLAGECFCPLRNPPSERFARLERMRRAAENIERGRISRLRDNCDNLASRKEQSNGYIR